MKDNKNVKLGVVGLAALTFGMMVGSGIFNLPQNMASSAGAGASLLAWLVTAAGMMLLTVTFKKLTGLHPEMRAGIYEYGRACFGDFAGFNLAWGYWLCTAFANIAYAVMLSDSFGAFLPPLLGHGLPTLLFCSALIWFFFFLVGSGMKTAKLMTVGLAVVKFATILLIIILLAVNFDLGLFSLDFWSGAAVTESLAAQVKGTMMVTLWCFIGIEGASVMAGRARKPRDVGRAGIIGFLAAWTLYLLVSMLCFGVMKRAEMAGLQNPSVAYVLRDICGEWAYWLVIASVIISLGGGWIAWTLVTAEVPYAAAKAGIFPRFFMRMNRNGMPIVGLFISSVIMQLFMFVVINSENAYLTTLDITGMMILPCYLASALYLCRCAASCGGTPGRSPQVMSLAVGVCCSLFCVWMIWAGGVRLLMETSVFYLFGFLFYIKTRRERHGRLFGRLDLALLAALLAAAAATLVTLF